MYGVCTSSSMGTWNQPKKSSERKSRSKTNTRMNSFSGSVELSAKASFHTGFKVCQRFMSSDNKCIFVNQYGGGRRSKLTRLMMRVLCTNLEGLTREQILLRFSIATQQYGSLKPLESPTGRSRPAKIFTCTFFIFCSQQLCVCQRPPVFLFLQCGSNNCQKDHKSKKRKALWCVFSPFGVQLTAVECVPAPDKARQPLGKFSFWLHKFRAKKPGNISVHLAVKHLSLQKKKKKDLHCTQSERCGTKMEEVDKDASLVSYDLHQPAVIGGTRFHACFVTGFDPSAPIHINIVSFIYLLCWDSARWKHL